MTRDPSGAETDALPHSERRGHSARSRSGLTLRASSWVRTNVMGLIICASGIAAVAGSVAHVDQRLDRIEERDAERDGLLRRVITDGQVLRETLLYNHTISPDSLRFPPGSYVAGSPSPKARP